MTQIKFYRVAQLPTSFSDSDKGTIYFVSGEGIYIYNGTELESYSVNTVTSPYVAISYSDLKALKEASGLAVGKKYRIIDYVTTTTQADTISAGHQFDVVVTAISSDKLSEDAQAILHDGDTYFENNTLSLWKLKYDIENDITKFAWADESGKGVIYEMTDEFNNTLPYDFKNIQFKRLYSIGHVDGYVIVPGFEAWSGLTFNETDYKYLYTFSMIGETDIYDTSLNIYSNNVNHLSVRNNCYLPNTIDGKLYLNNIVHVCSESLEEGYECEGVENTKTGINCYNISLKDKCDTWVLGNNCHDIIMNMKCEGWVCGDDCYNLTFGLNCGSWDLGHNCYNISVGDVCIEWVCGDDCSGWSTGTNNSNWNCGSDCSNWETGPECNYWVCGNKCHHWKTGSNCSYWTCGNDSHTWEVSDSNSFWTCGNAAYYWKVENKCSNFNVCNGLHGTSATNKLVLNFPASSTLTKQQQINASFNEYDMLTIWNPASPINYPIIKRTDTGPSESERIYLAPNVYNIWINNKLPKYITLALPKTDMVGEYILRFTVPSTVTNHSLVFSNEIKWVNNDVPTWDAGYTYEISIIDGYATFLKYSL